MNYYRCELILNGMSYDVTDDLQNWDDLQLAYKRSGLTGIVRSFTSSFDFVGATYNLIRQQIITKGMDFSASVVIYTQNNSWTWNKLFQSRLDVTSARVTSSVITLQAIDDTISSKLTAAKSTKYDIPVDEVQRDSMRFGRILMNNYEEFTLAPVETETIDYVTHQTRMESILQIHSGCMTLPMYTTRNSIPVVGFLEFADQQQNTYEQTGINTISVKDYICKATADVTAHIRMHLRGGSSLGVDNGFSVGLYKFSNSGRYISTIRQTSTTSGSSFMLTIDDYVQMQAGDRLVLMSIRQYVGGEDVPVDVMLEANQYRYSFVDGVSNFTLRIDFEAVGNPVSFDCVKPSALLQSLLDKICGAGEAVAQIDETPLRVSRCRLAAAESIRDFASAKFKTSFADFCSFMECVFGYVYIINGNAVSFVHRDTLFADAVAKEVADVTETELSVDSAMLYSSVTIGQKKQDYDEDNGLYELNFAQTYTTGRSVSDNTLTLQTPYRVDAYGVEYLVEKRAEQTKDSDSDADIFAIYTNGSDDQLAPDTSADVSNGDKVLQGYFNTEYHPRACIDANAAYLATFADVLEHASSEGNTSFYVGTESTTGNMDISGQRKYSPFVLSFSTADIDAPETLNEKVTAMWGSTEWHGWITDIKMMCAKTKAVTYTLCVAADSFNRLND